MSEIPHLLVHEHADNVGVVVVEGLTAGTDMLCCVTHDNSTFRLTAGADVPIGANRAERQSRGRFVEVRRRTAEPERQYVAVGIAGRQRDRHGHVEAGGGHHVVDDRCTVVVAVVVVRPVVARVTADLEALPEVSGPELGLDHPVAERAREHRPAVVERFSRLFDP